MLSEVWGSDAVEFLVRRENIMVPKADNSQVKILEREQKLVGRKWQLYYGQGRFFVSWNPKRTGIIFRRSPGTRNFSM